MDETVISPLEAIEGSVLISGAKNSALLILAGTVLMTEPVIISRVPNIADVHKMCDLLKILNVRVQWVGSDALLVDPSQIEYHELDVFSCGEIRASILFFGAMLGRFGRVSLRLPGGCNLGPRPIDYHVAVMEQFGAVVTFDECCVHAHLNREMVERSIHFPKQTVTGTVNALLCAIGLPGRTEIQGCALEPEIDDFIQCLSHLGARVKREGTVVVVEGAQSWKRGNYRIMADRIEAGTFLILTTIVQGRITLEDVEPMHLSQVLLALKAVGAEIEVHHNSITLSMSKRPLAYDVVAQQYPGFPTDLQPQWCVLSAISSGKSIVCDRIFNKRMDHIDELLKMGANIQIIGDKIHITGVQYLQGTSVFARNLRSAAAMFLAAYISVGKTHILQSSILNRGYSEFFLKIKSIEKQGVTS